MNKIINIVIPMAGEGLRFKKEGYKLPKPFVDVNGKMMIEKVLESLNVSYAKYILILQKSFLSDYMDKINYLVEKFNVEYVVVEQKTQGASCSALAAHKIINNNIPVLFADSDNLFNTKVVNAFLDDCFLRQLDGCLTTFKSCNPCFSFVDTNEEGKVIRTVEKEAISDDAVAGLYYFKNGFDFVDQAINMMIYNDKVKGEFYMSNVYNWLIKSGANVGIYNIKAKDFECLGTPDHLRDYLNKVS